MIQPPEFAHVVSIHLYSSNLTNFQWYPMRYEYPNAWLMPTSENNVLDHK